MVFESLEYDGFTLLAKMREEITNMTEENLKLYERYKQIVEYIKLKSGMTKPEVSKEEGEL